MNRWRNRFGNPNTPNRQRSGMNLPSPTRRHRSTRCCRLERLESRDLLAGDSPLVFNGGAVDALQEAGSHTSSIGGQVLLAAGQPCEQHAGSPVENVTFRLLGEQGELLAQTESDIQGVYRFDDLQPGVYAVQQIQPIDLQTGKAHVGTGGGIAFESNLIGEIVVGSGDALDYYDFCELPLALDPEQNESVDRAIEAHGSGLESTPSEQLVGVAQRFGLLSSHMPSAIPGTAYETDSEESLEVSQADKEQPTNGESSASRKLSSQRALSRPRPDAFEFPEELWDAMESIGIDPLFAFTEDLPGLVAEDSATAMHTVPKTGQNNQRATPSEEEHSQPEDEIDDPAHIATNANRSERAEAKSNDHLRQ